MMTEPFEAFFADPFARSVVIDGAAVPAIFDNDYAVPGGMSASQPQLHLMTADVPADPVGLAVVVGDDRYQIVEHRPDGTGVSVVMLERMP